MRVKDMISSKGNVIANQFIISDNGDTYFQSYKSIIAVKKANDDILLDEYYWDYSKTTSKYRRMFLNETTKETQAKIKAGIYKLANLN